MNSAILLVFIVVCVAICLIGYFGGRMLVIDEPKPSDVIIVAAGAVNDVRLRHGMELLRAGLAKELILSVSDHTWFGRPVRAYAESFIENAAPEIRAHLHIWCFHGGSTRSELAGLEHRILEVDPDAKRCLLVTSSYHTRRALSVSCRVMPQFAWAVAAAPDPAFGVNWWQRREWAKTALHEWQKNVWWFLIEQWKA